MAKCIMAGIDVHDENLLVKIAVGKGDVVTWHIGGGREGHEKLISKLKQLKKQKRVKRVVIAYEASGAGYGLHDAATDAGFESHLIAPSCMPRSQKQKRQRNDDRDALGLLEQLRGHLLAGNNLCDVWIPDMETRDDREVIRARLSAKSTTRSLKARIQMMLKRSNVRAPSHVDGSWSLSHRAWLRELHTGKTGNLKTGSRIALEALLRQLEKAEEEVELLDEAVVKLSQSPRYKTQVKAITRNIKGVAVFTAMVFLTEVGDMTRFRNRRQIASYLGLCPSSDESGEDDDRKGHITHCGPGRVRSVLCQAAQSASRFNERHRPAYMRICERNPRHKKIGIVAVMRRLAIEIWHIAMEHQPEGIYDAAQKPTIRKKEHRRRNVAVAV